MYSSCEMAVRTFRLVIADTVPTSLITRDTVAVETPAADATSFRLTATSRRRGCHYFAHPREGPKDREAAATRPASHRMTQYDKGTSRLFSLLCGAESKADASIQKTIFAPNCNCRIDPADVITPKFGSWNELSG